MFFLILVFIWGQSVLPPRASDSQSQWIASYLVKWFGNDVDYVNHIVRKCAHFTEYMILGILATRTVAGSTQYFVTDAPAPFAAVGASFMSQAPQNVQHIDFV